ncbi:MAG: Polysaccharide biosynthesis/export protein [bacterium ADurb.Bin243]|nr:MAG: Polysaccharide biosynthesis/export protein [bacterium ADurb.Bin243]
MNEIKKIFKSYKLDFWNIAGRFSFMMPALSITGFFLFSLLTSGAVSAGSGVEEQLGVESAAALMQNPVKSEYIIGAGDLIKVFVYENPEYADNYRIGPDGKMSMPIIGTLTAAGLSREDLAAVITNRLARYISNPIVNVIISEYNNNFVYLLGDISNPGRHDFKNEMTLLSILPQAGLENIKNQSVKCDIIRQGGTVFTLDLSDYDKVLQNRILLNLKLCNNDLLYFSKADNIKGRVYILGSVKNPGLFAYDKAQGLKKLIDDKIELSGKTAKLLKVIRKMPERTIQFEYNLGRAAALNPEIQDGDMVYIPRSSDKSFSYCIKQIAPYAVVSLIGAEAVRNARNK